jgi:signal transduction histidine kinase
MLRLDSLLLASKVDTAEFSIKNHSLGSVNIRSLVARVIEILSLQASQSGVNITLDIDETLTMRAHEKYAEIVLSNLIGNAIKYSRRTTEGKVVISAEKKI